ncbi:MAG: tRNA1(Val) (adenine(37)-N6)-methyltransferase [Bacilli bacterium]|nr:tRNA1(Val) (adenine(37)-N6)-methyltransferase [Bacilli bacterium]MBQ6538650.1 tRNA1(Val) (adenine(37)-N6)-methyltransferase [Bacilli bacterium]
MERINDIVGYKNRRIYQDTDCFSFSLDSLILGNFSTIRKNDKRILDICTGNGIIPFILSLRCDKKIEGVEIQDKLYELAIKSNKLNNLEDQITFYHEDIKDFVTKDRLGKYDLITCNPPYFKDNDINNNLTMEKTIARHEIKLKLDELIECVSKLLDNNGTFSLVHRSERIAEIIDLLNKNNLEVKRLKFIYKNCDSNAEMVFLESRKNGNVGLKVEKPFIVYNLDGSYTDEYKHITEEVLK